MPFCDLGDLRLHYRDEGDPNGAPLILCHALGLNLTLWDGLIALLPPGVRVIRYDHRGHGLSDCPPGPYAMGALIRDGERLMDRLGLRDAVVLGLSLGGLVAQGLAVKRLDLVRGLILSNTAPRIATAAIWADRIAQVQAGGMAAITEATVARWFARPFRATPAALHWRDQLARCNPEGWAACAAAIAGSDFYTPTAGLTLPTLAIAGTDDGSTPPDMLRELADLIKGSRLALIRGAGHMPLIEKPQDYAVAVNDFLAAIGHASPSVTGNRLP